MTCANCALNVERALKQLGPDLYSVSVSLSADRASVEFDSDKLSPRQIAAAVEQAGYRPVLPVGEDSLEDEEKLARQSEASRQRLALLVGLLFTVPLFCLSMAADFLLLGQVGRSLRLSTAEFD